MRSVCPSGFKFTPGKFQVLSGRTSDSTLLGNGSGLGTLPLVAMLCKAAFQIEPLKHEVHTIAALPYCVTDIQVNA